MTYNVSIRTLNATFYLMQFNPYLKTF